MESSSTVLERPCAPAPTHSGVPSFTLLERSGTSDAPINDRVIDGLLTRILDEVDYGLMLVTQTGRVCFANHSALLECTHDRSMRLHDGHVQPRHGRDHESFFKALATSRLGRRSMLTLHAGELPLSLAVVPMKAADEHDDAASLLVFGKRQVCESLSVNFFAMSHGLTATETSVLKDLCGGMRPTNIARRSGVALSTVRTQITSIRFKTGSASIGELVRKMTVLPPILSALNRTLPAASVTQ